MKPVHDLLFTGLLLLVVLLVVLLVLSGRAR